MWCRNRDTRNGLISIDGLTSGHSDFFSRKAKEPSYKFNGLRLDE